MTDCGGEDDPGRIRFLVDDREARSGTVAALEAVEGVDLRFGRLPVGDYEVDGVLFFERKTLPDLAVSIQDGRLFHQAWSLSVMPAPARGVLILEGTASDWSGIGMRREAVQGALITVSVFFGVPLLRARDGEESARLMVYTAQQAKVMKRGALPRHAKRPKGKRRAQLAMLQGLPGVGPGRAERLLDQFGSVEAVLTAAADELAAVHGIGKQTAQGIRWLVGEGGRTPYGP